MKTECSICIENKASSRIIICPFCKCEICTKCVKTYIFDYKKSSTIECMKCNKIWSRSILQDIFSKTFVDGKLKKHIKDMMFLEQKTQIPNTLYIVERLKEIMKEMSIENVNSLSNNLLEYYIYWAMEGYKPENEKTEYVYPCANSECLGHVNTVWKCTMCKGTTCKNCLVFIPENCNNHECKKEDIETANIIKKTSKPCPGCQISIIKTEGCDQMWCSKCHVAFDWKTGKKVTTRIHNPEYYRWLRDTNGFVPREQGDDPCNNKLHRCMDKVSQLVRNKKIERKIIYKLFSIERCILHIEDYMINRIQHKINDTNTWHTIQRVRFLIKYISEEQFKTNLGRKYKETLYLEEKMAICTTLRDVIRDRLVNFIDKPPEELVKIQIDNLKSEIEIINNNINMSNNILKNIMELYGYTVDRIKYCNIIELN